MSYQAQFSKLYDIPSLPDSVLKQKFIQTTDVYDDPNTVLNFMKETLRYTGPDAPLYEEDLPRQRNNALSQSIMSTYENGSRYSHAPFHPELFLGDLTKDQRMSVNEPMVAQMANQNKYRQERYIRGKLQDVADVRSEGIVGEKQMLKQIRQGYANTATRMGGIFNDSNDTIITKANPNPGNATHQVGQSIKEDQSIYETKYEKILPQYGTDIVGKLNNLVGVQWEVQPEAKPGISSVSNIYRSKQEVDQSANAVFRLGEQDTKFKTETTDIKSGSTIKPIDSFKAARQNAQNVSVVTNKDSMKNRIAAKMLLPPTPINQVDRFVGTQNAKSQIESKGTVYKFHTSQNRVESLVERLSDKNKSMTGFSIATTVPAKDRIAIIYKTNQTQKFTPRTEDMSYIQTASIKLLKKAFTNKKETMNEQKKQKENKNEHYVNGVPVKNVDHVKNVRMTKNKFTQQSEQIMTNPTGSTTLPTPSTMKDFEFDTDPTMNNSYQTRRGVNQRMTRLSQKQDQDSTISPLNDTIVPFRTKYSN